MADKLSAQISVAISDLEMKSAFDGPNITSVLDGPIIWHSSTDSKYKHYVFCYDCSICKNPHNEYVSLKTRMVTRNQLKMENPTQWKNIKLLKCNMC